MKFSKFFSSDFEASSKRLAFLVLILVWVVAFFLVMYIKIEIANKEIFSDMVWYTFLLILITGAYITSELIFIFLNKRIAASADVEKTKAQQGISDTTIIQKQEVKAENVANVTGSVAKE